MNNLRSFSEEYLKDIIFSALAKQFDIDKATISLNDNIVEKFYADSVDLVGILLIFEQVFADSSKIAFQLPENAINTIKTVNDLYSILNTTLFNIETKLNNNETIKPNLTLLE